MYYDYFVIYLMFNLSLFHVNVVLNFYIAKFDKSIMSSDNSKAI